MQELRRPKISGRRPTAEVAIGIGAFAAAATSILVVPSIEGGLALIMAAIAVIDRRHFIIPNELTAASFVLGLLNAALRTPEAVMREMVDGSLRAMALAGALLAVRAFYRGLRHREGIGLGDVKLAGVAGAWLDWNMMPLSIDVAALAALSVYGARSALRGRPLRPTSRLPFGQFLAPAIWLCWLLETALFGL
jgi:leader peptidase (prepilin peptidase) / N-methyltransferase